MHPRTEALLTLRDGEPIDAALRADLLSDPVAVAELERLRKMRVALGELPDLEPPPAGWQRVAAELDREPAPRIRAPLRWAAGAATAAAAATAALLYLGGPANVQDPEPTTVVASDSSPRPLTQPALPPAYVALVQESARLDRVLARVPSQRPLMTARTASTIVGLEDRIALVDEQLTLGAVQEMELPVRKALWEERVELMNALVHVRYANTQSPGF